MCGRGGEECDREHSKGCGPGRDSLLILARGWELGVSMLSCNSVKTGALRCAVNAYSASDHHADIVDVKGAIGAEGEADGE
jgi:hypothetical protein